MKSSLMPQKNLHNLTDTTRGLNEPQGRCVCPAVRAVRTETLRLAVRSRCGVWVCVVAQSRSGDTGNGSSSSCWSGILRGHLCLVPRRSASRKPCVGSSVRWPLSHQRSVAVIRERPGRMQASVRTNRSFGFCEVERPRPDESISTC